MSKNSDNTRVTHARIQIKLIEIPDKKVLFENFVRRFFPRDGRGDNEFIFTTTACA